jgi:glycosyltransferase involved in cell wall biosynthesis
MIEYGIHNYYLDVTSQAWHQYVKGNSLIIPGGVKNFNFYFTDPCPGVVKELRITMGSTVYCIREDDLQAHIIEIPNPILMDLPLIHKVRDLVTKLDPHYLDLIIFNEIKEIEVSIVMTSHNRSKQTYYTLDSIERSLGTGIQVIIVDDSTTDPLDEFLLKRFNLSIWYLRLKNKFWINPCVNYNIGFKYVKGEKIIIQNAEVAHIGDLINLVQNTSLNNKYLVFDVCDLSSPQSDLRLRRLPLNYDTIYNNFNNEWTWYQHSTICNTNFHFLTALTRSTLDLLQGMDYDFSMGLWYDDHEWLFRLENEGITIINVSHEIYKVLGLHQWHDRESKNIRTNKDLFEAKKRYYQKHGRYLQLSDQPLEKVEEQLLDLFK